MWHQLLRNPMKLSFFVVKNLALHLAFKLMACILEKFEKLLGDLEPLIEVFSNLPSGPSKA